MCSAGTSHWTKCLIQWMSCQQVSLAEEFLPMVAQVFLLTSAMKGMRPAHSTVFATFLLLSITHIQSLAQQQLIRDVDLMWGKRNLKICKPSRFQPTNLPKFGQTQTPRFQDLEATLREIPYHYAWRPSPKHHLLGRTRNGCKRRFGRRCVARHLGSIHPSTLTVSVRKQGHNLSIPPHVKELATSCLQLHSKIIQKCSIPSLHSCCFPLWSFWMLDAWCIDGFSFAAFLNKHFTSLYSPLSQDPMAQTFHTN